jgi:hypothetical protein
VITGYNTDVQHDGRVYHVQTEDKGRDNPIIETLIYSGGEILAARQSSYADLIEQGAAEEAIAGRIEEQHNQLIADVRAGRYAEKKHRPFGEGIITSRSFDEVVLDYLRSLTGADHIVLEVSGGDGCAAGRETTFAVRVMRPLDGAGVPGAAVKIRWISSVDRARVLAEGKTGEGGRLQLTCALPNVARGSAALIIQATAGKESAEVKRTVGGPIREAAG